MKASLMPNYARSENAAKHQYKKLSACLVSYWNRANLELMNQKKCIFKMWEGFNARLTEAVIAPVIKQEFAPGMS